jgi:hypothetical protein
MSRKANKKKLKMSKNAGKSRYTRSSRNERSRKEGSPNEG